MGLAGGLAFTDLSVASDGSGGTALSVAASGEILAVLLGVNSALIDENDFLVLGA